MAKKKSDNTNKAAASTPSALEPSVSSAPGFAEQQTSFFPAGPAYGAAFAEDDGGTLTVGPAGRVLIPAELRQAMGIAEGDALVATLEGQELRLMSTKAALKKAQAMVAEYVPAHVSLVDELLAERRREFEIEERRYGGHADTASVKTRKDRT